MTRTARIIDEPRLTRHLVGRHSFANDPVFLVDVGASGGIESYWYEFGDQLRAIGFDPLCAEIDRLNAEATPDVSYVAAWVTAPSESVVGERSDSFFARTSATRAAELASLDYVREHFNIGAEVTVADERIVLDHYFDDARRAEIDFIKVDTDGHDLEVLRGCDAILSSGRVLGVAAEAQFQGPFGPEAGVFGNLDSLLRERGFSLFDLEVYRYSRSALPADFVYEIPAQTVTGQVSWGDAIYFRDLGDPQYERRWAFEPTVEDVLKTACFLEIFGMPDCSAEVLVKYRERLADRADVTGLLDILASEQTGRETTHAALVREFEEDARRRFAP